MRPARLTLDPPYRIGEIYLRLWAVSSSMSLDIPLVRYPRSCFSSAYEWELGMKPQE